MRDESAVLKSRDGEAMVLLGVTAKGHLDGLLFELAVEQRYCNPRKKNIETLYTFPLPFGAVLLGLEFQLGTEMLDGVVVEREKAEADYEEAIEKGDTAIMLEQVGDGIYTVNLGNLMPGEEAVIRYRYAQLLRFEKGHIRLAIPTVIAPRFGEPEEAGLEPHQMPITDVLADYPFAVTIELRGEVGQSGIDSPSHPIKVSATASGVTVALARNGHLDRDFILVIDGLAGTSLTAIGRDGDGFVALASFCPAFPMVEDIAPLSLKILVDCSGSMAGDSIQSARRAVRRILEQLTPADTFSLTRFGSKVEHYFTGPRSADSKNIHAALLHLYALDADMGGTELESALQSVFRHGGEGSADILLITDGEVWKTESLISASRKAGQRIFAVAVGSAPAESLHRALAEQTGGACECVAPDEDVESAIVRMFARMRAPRVRDLVVAWPGAPVWHTPLPQAAFDGETVHVFAGYESRPEGEVRLGYRAGDEVKNREESIALTYAETNADTLPRIAAAERLKGLAKGQHKKIALRYQLVTSETSYLILHIRAEGEKAKSLPELQQVAQMHAAGWGGLGTVDSAVLGSAVQFSSLDAGSVSVFSRRSGSLIGFGAEQPSGQYGIRAFLRNQVGEDAAWITPQRFLGRPGRGLWSRLITPAYPTKLDDLLGADVPWHVIDFLKRLVYQGESEDAVVKAFIEALVESPAGAKITRHGRRAIRALFTNEYERSALREHLRAVFASATPTEWPAPPALADSGEDATFALPI